MNTFICIFCSLLYFLMIAFFFVGWRRLKKTTRFVNSGTTKVSVIVPVRNEAANIVACLSSITQQIYPHSLFEIIMIDDYSEDETIKIAADLKIPNMKIISLREKFGSQFAQNANKKRAIEEGVAASTGHLIVTADGDCTVTKYWLDLIVAHYERNDHKLIAGPVRYSKGHGFLAAFQELDFISMIGITGACIQNGFPVMCNGANLAFEKSVFHDVGGFKGVDHLASGDDVFLLHKVHDKCPGSVGFLKNIDAAATTSPTATVSEFIEQRKRWVSKSTQYQNIWITVTLAFSYLFNAMLLTLLIFSIFNPVNYLRLFLICCLVKMISDLLFLIPVSGFFNRLKLLFLFPAFQIAHWIYVLVIGIWGTFGSYNWKGRNVERSFVKI